MFGLGECLEYSVSCFLKCFFIMKYIKIIFIFYFIGSDLVQCIFKL